MSDTGKSNGNIFLSENNLFKFLDKLNMHMSNTNTIGFLESIMIRKQTHATENNPRFTSLGSVFKNAQRQILSLVVLAFLFFTAQAQTTVVNVSNSGNGGPGITGTYTVPSGGPYLYRITAKGGSGGLNIFNQIGRAHV